MKTMAKDKLARPGLTPVRDVMSTDPICVMRSDSIREVARTLDDNGISGVPVVDARDVLVGVVSRTDVLHQLIAGSDEGPSGLFDLLETSRRIGIDPEDLGVVEDFMTTDPITARAEETVESVSRRLVNEGVHRAVVVDEDGSPIGIVTTTDLLRRYAEA